MLSKSSLEKKNKKNRSTILERQALKENVSVPDKTRIMTASSNLQNDFSWIVPRIVLVSLIGEKKKKKKNDLWTFTGIKINIHLFFCYQILLK